jgi:hypothetical protein
VCKHVPMRIYTKVLEKRSREDAQGDPYTLCTALRLLRSGLTLLWAVLATSSGLPVRWTNSVIMSLPSNELTRAIKEFFVKGEFALCTCHSKTPVFQNPPAGYTSICDNNTCGKTFAQLEAHYIPLVQDMIDKEAEAVKDAANSSNGKPFPMDEVKKSINKPSVLKMFDSIIHPAFEAFPGEWDIGFHGKDYVELVLKYCKVYEAVSQQKRSAFLDEIRGMNKDDHEEILEQLNKHLATP